MDMMALRLLNPPRNQLRRPNPSLRPPPRRKPPLGQSQTIKHARSALQVMLNVIRSRIVRLRSHYIPLRTSLPPPLPSHRRQQRPKLRTRLPPLLPSHLRQQRRRKRRLLHILHRPQRYPQATISTSAIGTISNFPAQGPQSLQSQSTPRK